MATAWAHEALAELRARSLHRQLEPLDSPQGAHVRVAGRTYVNFSSNDYLGLANDAAVIATARAAYETYGAGTGASRLVVGDTRAHRKLEAALAAFEGTQSALLFNSGYAANVGTLQSLLEPGDVVFSDALNHASLIDGCRLSRARVAVYRHGDVEHLDALLKELPGRRRLVVTETVFSMDGDVAPLSSLAEVCARHGAALMVDEAHATGVLGATGAGLCEATGVHADVKVGTLSKALGGFGAFVACSAPVREVLLNRARSFVFSTALPPAMCEAAHAALIRLQEPSLRAALHARIAQLAHGLEAGEGVSPIFPLVLGEPEAALAASARLREAGLLVKAIRPPTVPEGTSRLRISVSAAHSEADVALLLSHLLRSRHEHR